MVSPNKRRSQRLRKKLRVGEFQELGFDFEVSWREPLAEQDEDALLDRFLDELILPRGLALGGWVSGGFVCAMERGSATEDDREALRAWLEACPQAGSVRVGPLRDVWYSEMEPL